MFRKSNLLGKQMNHTIVFTIGDFSDDGHGKADDVRITSNRSADEIASLYKQACDKHGFVFDKRVCNNYGESCIDAADLAFMNSLGYVTSPDMDVEEHGAYLDCENLLLMFLFFVSTVDPDFQYAIAKDEAEYFFICGAKERNFGLGYGLFH